MQGWGVGLQNKIFKENLGRAPQGRTPCTIFTKFSWFMGSFIPHQLLKFGGFAQGVLELWGFKDGWGYVFPQISVPRSGETIHWIEKRFGGARMSSTSSVTMPSLVGL